MVVSRYVGQRVLLDGGRIQIEVMKVKGQRVLLRFEAPRSVEIDWPDAEEDRAAREAAKEAAGNV